MPAGFLGCFGRCFGCRKGGAWCPGWIFGCWFWSLSGRSRKTPWTRLVCLRGCRGMTLVKNPCNAWDMFEWPCLLFGERRRQSSQPELRLMLDTGLGQGNNMSCPSVQTFVLSSSLSTVMPFSPGSVLGHVGRLLALRANRVAQMVAFNESLLNLRASNPVSSKVLWQLLPFDQYIMSADVHSSPMSSWSDGQIFADLISLISHGSAWLLKRLNQQGQIFYILKSR